jgi:heme/copper-type cytochrome/quinol oxidase subunit 2
MPAEDTVFNVLYDKYMFWSIVVGILTFGWMFIAMLRYRDGVEPVENMEKYHIEVGSFPVDSHNTKLEVMFYVLPTILVVWLTMMALASNTAVWTIPADEDTFNVDIVGKQWFWEFHYQEDLTWEDVSSNIDVNWTGSMLMVHTHGSEATNVTVEIDGVETDYSIDLAAEMLTLSNMYFDRELHSVITVYDAEDQLLHTWEHLPTGTILSSAGGQHLIIPCDESITLDLFSRPHTDTNPAYVGVQHAFWLPEWGVKEDLVPGLEAGTVMTFFPDDAGTFPIRCAEYCGLDHSKMIGNIDIVARDNATCEVDTKIQKTGSQTGNDSTGGGY